MIELGLIGKDGRRNNERKMTDEIKWWVVLVVTIICMFSIPGLLQMLWEEIKKEYFDDKK